jgi:hypothetical protein
MLPGVEWLRSFEIRRDARPSHIPAHYADGAAQTEDRIEAGADDYALLL